jgi:hypothetical protein
MHYTRVEAFGDKDDYYQGIIKERFMGKLAVAA